MGVVGVWESDVAVSSEEVRVGETAFGNVRVLAAESGCEREDALVCLFGIKECYIVHVLSNSHAMHGCVGIKGMGMGLNLVLTEMRALRI